MPVSLMKAQLPPPNFSLRCVPPSTLQDLTTPVAPEMQMSHHQSQAVIEGLEELVSGHQQPPAQLIETGLGFAATEIVESSGSGALIDASEELQKQVPNSEVPSSIFTTVSVTESNMPSTFETPSYKEVINGLPSLWEGQKREIESLTDDFWKNQEFPLARIKKIMRIDDDVKMISTEVPVMFSKVLEIFITELTMRSWLHTEESKRRTVQRSDIALAITKHDMFDFLIDIVPREEIQFKTKTQKDGGEGVQVVVPPDTMQGYIQQLINQTLTYIASGSGGDEGEAEANAGTNTVQQLQLLQQLVQLQQAQQEQQQQQEQQEQQEQSILRMDPVPETPTLATHERHHRHGPEASGLGGGVDIRFLQSSSSSETPTSPLTRLTSSMGSTLKQIAKNGGQCQINSTEVQQGAQHVLYDQHSLHHMGCQEDFEYSQQQQQEIFTSGQHSQITTVVIPQPLDSLVQQSQPQTVSSSVDSLSAATFHLQHQTQQHGIVQDSLSNQLESVATEQFIAQQLPVELTSKYGTSRGRDGDVGGQGDVNFQQHAP